MKSIKYIKEIMKCSECPFFEEDTIETEENGKWVASEYKCLKKNKSLGYLRWMYSGHEGTFTDEIPDWCPIDN